MTNPEQAFQLLKEQAYEVENRINDFEIKERNLIWDKIKHLSLEPVLAEIEKQTKSSRAEEPPRLQWNVRDSTLYTLHIHPFMVRLYEERDFSGGRRVTKDHILEICYNNTINGACYTSSQDSRIKDLYEEVDKLRKKMLREERRLRKR